MAGQQKPDVATIAQKLREIETTDEGADYLQSLRLGKEDLVLIASELGRTRVERLSRTKLVEAILAQAIGARRKYGGLRNW